MCLHNVSLVSLTVAQGLFKGVLKVSQGCYKMFHRCSKGFSRNFKDVSRELQGSITGVLMIFQGCFKSVVLRVSLGCLTVVLRLFQWFFNEF